MPFHTWNVEMDTKIGQISLCGFVSSHIGYFFIIPVYLQPVQVHSVIWLKDVDEWLGEGHSLALFYI
jgi:hypothetical protein